MKILASTSFIGTTGYANHAQSFFTALDKLTPVKVETLQLVKRGIGPTTNHIARNHTLPLKWEKCFTNKHYGKPTVVEKTTQYTIQKTLPLILTLF